MLHLLPSFDVERILALLWPAAELAAVSLEWRRLVRRVLHQRVDAAIQCYAKQPMELSFEPHWAPVTSALEYSNVINFTAHYQRPALPAWCAAYLLQHCHYCKQRVGASHYWWAMLPSLDRGMHDLYDESWKGLEFHCRVLFDSALPHLSAHAGVPVCPKQLSTAADAEVTICSPLHWGFGQAEGGVWLERERVPALHLRAPYFLPGLHQFVHNNLGEPLEQFCANVLRAAAEARPAVLTPRDGLVCALGAQAADRYCDFLDRAVRQCGALSRRRWQRCPERGLLGWFGAQLPALCRLYAKEQIEEWLEGWENYFAAVDPALRRTCAAHFRRLASASKRNALNNK